jgi:hypothetical protein
MSLKQKLLWSIPYAVLIVGFALAGQKAISSEEAPPASIRPADHSTVNWSALQPEPDPSPRAIAAYD